MNRITLAAAALILAAFPATASAQSPKEAINSCAQAIRAELPLDAAAVDVKFKRIKGSASSKTVKLDVAAEDVRGRVTCKVRRDQAPVIKWDETLDTFREELAARETKTADASNAGE